MLGYKIFTSDEFFNYALKVITPQNLEEASKSMPLFPVEYLAAIKKGFLPATEPPTTDMRTIKKFLLKIFNVKNIDEIDINSITNPDIKDVVNLLIIEIKKK
jgi:hypothetical protein